MNTLTAIEAERVDQILQHAYRRLELLSYVPSTDDETLLSQLSCQPVSSSLDRLWLTENQLTEIYDISAMGGRDMFTIKAAHRAVKACCRNFFADKGSYAVLTNSKQRCTNEYASLLRVLLKYKGHIKTQLMTTVEDEAANRIKLQELTEKVRRNEEIREVLQSKLENLIEEKDRLSSSLDMVLRKLQHEKEDLSAANQAELDTITLDTDEAISKASGDHSTSMRQLVETVESLERQLADALKRDRDEEQQLRRDKIRLEKDVNSKIAQYDDEMETRRRSHEEIGRLFELEKAEYALLKDHFDRVDSDNELMQEESMAMDAVRRREDYMRAVMNKAATRIQSLFMRKFAEGVKKLRDKLSKKKGKGAGKEEREEMRRR